jgi:hypothetical protein
MILWNAELTKRLTCSDKEKAALPSIIQDLLAIADRARIDGIQPLISASPSDKPTMLSYGFRLIAEGLSTESLEEILAIYLSTSTLSGFEFLKQCVYVEALLGIAGGDSRELLLRKLAPYCGAEKAFSLLKALDPENGDNSQ